MPIYKATTELSLEEMTSAGISLHVKSLVSVKKEVIEMMKPQAFSPPSRFFQNEAFFIRPLVTVPS